MREALLTLVLLTAGLTGCIGTDDATETARDFPACEHPWPCADGSE